MESPFEVIFVGLGFYPSHGRFGPAEFPHFDLFTVREGNARLHLAGEVLDLVLGDAVLIPPNHRFHGEFSAQGGALWILHFSGYQPSATPSALAGLQTPRVIRRALTSDLERRMTLRLYELHLLPHEPLRDDSERLLARLILNHVEQVVAHPETVSSRKQEFDKLLAETIPQLESGINVTDLARRAGLSESYFRAEFQRLYGRSPQLALKELRLEEARRLLQETRSPVKEISQRVGYHDVSAFHRAFLRTYGQTPVAFRRGSRLAI